MAPMRSGFWRGALFRLLAVALAIGTVSDGRTSRVAYAQGATDPIVVKARAAINLGRYAEAEALLKPAAERAPDGEAALELGLFYDMMGRRDEARPCCSASPTCRPDRARPLPSTRGSAVRPARSASFSSPTTRTGLRRRERHDDPAVHTGWGELFLQVHNNAEAAKSFQDALASGRQVDSGAARNGAGAAGRQPSGGRQGGRAGALARSGRRRWASPDGADSARQERSFCREVVHREGEGDQSLSASMRWR